MFSFVVLYIPFTLSGNLATSVFKISTLLGVTKTRTLEEKLFFNAFVIILSVLYEILCTQYNEAQRGIFC